MFAYLSGEWIDAMNHAVSTSASLRDRTRAMELRVQFVVTHVPVVDEPDTRSYTVWFDHGTNGVTAEDGADADLSFTCDYATAVAIATGVERAQSAFMAGRLSLVGDVRSLLDRADVLAALDDAADAVRAQTSYGVLDA